MMPEKDPSVLSTRSFIRILVALEEGMILRWDGGALEAL